MRFVLTSFMTPTRELPEIAAAAEDAGWSGITFSDHIINLEKIDTPYPYTDDGSRRWEAFTEWPDPMVTIGALSMVTRKLRFMTNVYVLPMRNIFIAAKELSTAAVLSDNRLELTIGIGWCKEEFTLMGQNFHDRGKRTDEMLRVLKKLLSGEMVSHEGRYYNFPPLEMNPVPEQPIPIRVGGISDAALRRAALLADGWLSDWQTSKDIVDSIGKIRQLRAEAGLGMKQYSVTATPSDAFDVDSYRQLEESGVTDILMIAYAPDEPVEKKKDGLKRFAEQFIAPLS